MDDLGVRETFADGLGERAGDRENLVGPLPAAQQVIEFVVTARGDGAVAIPLYAVVDLDGRKVVYVAENDKAQLRPVKIDRIIGELAVIKQGLDLEERLIVKGQQMLADGSPIKVEDK